MFNPVTPSLIPAHASSASTIAIGSSSSPPPATSKQPRTSISGAPSHQRTAARASTSTSAVTTATITTAAPPLPPAKQPPSPPGITSKFLKLDFRFWAVLQQPQTSPWLLTSPAIVRQPDSLILTASACMDGGKVDGPLCVHRHPEPKSPPKARCS